jgi:hypothetical protein
MGTRCETAAAPATETGERTSNDPLRPWPWEGRRKPRPGSQDTCLAPSSCYQPGCADNCRATVAATQMPCPKSSSRRNAESSSETPAPQAKASWSTTSWQTASVTGQRGPERRLRRMERRRTLCFCHELERGTWCVQHFEPPRQCGRVLVRSIDCPANPWAAPRTCTYIR